MGFRVAISYHECWSKFALDLDERIGARRQLFVLSARVSGLHRGAFTFTCAGGLRMLQRQRRPSEMLTLTMSRVFETDAASTELELDH